MHSSFLFFLSLVLFNNYLADNLITVLRRWIIRIKTDNVIYKFLSRSDSGTQTEVYMQTHIITVFPITPRAIPPISPNSHVFESLRHCRRLTLLSSNSSIRNPPLRLPHLLPSATFATKFPKTIPRPSPSQRTQESTRPQEPSASCIRISVFTE